MNALISTNMNIAITTELIKMVMMTDPGELTESSCWIVLIIRWGLLNRLVGLVNYFG